MLVYQRDRLKPPARKWTANAATVTSHGLSSSGSLFTISVVSPSTAFQGKVVTGLSLAVDRKMKGLLKLQLSSLASGALWQD